MIDKIDFKMFRSLLIGGYERLSSQKEWVNNLNVFPVPDGDTGSNMTLTLKGGLSGDGNIVEKSLMAARGNSGIILSQFLKGFVDAVNHKDQIDTRDFAIAIKEGEKAARNAIKNPVEGTIITVMKEASRCAIQSSRRERDFIRLLENIEKAAKLTLEKTPEMLPVLKDAGVVDAGGQGFVYILEGVLYSLREYNLENDIVPHISKRLHIWKTLASIENIYRIRNLLDIGNHMVKIRQNRTIGMDLAWERALSHIKNRKIKTIPALKQFARRLISVWERKIEYKYDVECLVHGENIEKQFLEGEIAPFGDSILVVDTPSFAKVHIHTNEPEKIFEICSRYGELNDKFIEDMEEQQHEFITAKQDIETGIHQKVIIILPGDGFCKIAESMGAVTIKSTNPSTKEVLEYLNSEDFHFVLPANGDAIPASLQALKCSKKSGVVIPAKTIPEGMSALLAYNPESEPNENEENMREAIKRVKTGKVTISARDAQFGAQKVSEGDIISIFEKEIRVHNSIDEAVFELARKMEGEIFTLFFGMYTKKEDAETVLKELKSTFTEKDFELYYGGQPFYQYIIGAE
ncbi:MAG: DAK2 domain-containing protein [candidate division WOR-3 bacterium]|nr:DAK2 domain-containing protein [candidate division WOR-3 bacterium]